MANGELVDVSRWTVKSEAGPEDLGAGALPGSALALPLGSHVEEGFPNRGLGSAFNVDIKHDSYEKRRPGYLSPGLVSQTNRKSQNTPASQAGGLCRNITWWI